MVEIEYEGKKEVISLETYHVRVWHRDAYLAKARVRLVGRGM